MKELIALFYQQAGWLLIIPTGIALIRWSELSKPQKVIGFYLFVSLAIHIISFFYWRAGRNNLPFLHFFTIFEYYTILYFLQISRAKLMGKYLFTTFLIVFTLLFFTEGFVWSDWLSFHPYSLTISVCILAGCSIFWFIQIAGDFNISFSSMRNLIYINCGILIYFSASSVLFSLNNLLSSLDRQLLVNVWSIHTILNLVMYMFFSIGLWKSHKV